MPSIVGSDWTDRKVDLIVAHYIDMRVLELRGERVVIAERNASRAPSF